MDYFIVGARYYHRHDNTLTFLNHREDPYLLPASFLFSPVLNSFFWKAAMLTTIPPMPVLNSFFWHK
jgi:hypothetical protein